MASFTSGKEYKSQSVFIFLLIPSFQLGQHHHQLEQKGKKVIRYGYSPKHHMKNSIYESESQEPVLLGSRAYGLEFICHQFSYYIHHYISGLYSTSYQQVHATVIQVEKQQQQQNKTKQTNRDGEDGGGWRALHKVAHQASRDKNWTRFRSPWPDCLPLSSLVCSS